MADAGKLSKVSPCVARFCIDSLRLVAASVSKYYSKYCDSDPTVAIAMVITMITATQPFSYYYTCCCFYAGTRQLAQDSCSSCGYSAIVASYSCRQSNEQ